MVRVKELPQPDFEAHCAGLAGRVRLLQAEALVGIRTGGAVVAGQMQPHLGLPLFMLSASRSGTAIKKGMRLQGFLRLLPKSANNALRIVEHYSREFRYQQGHKVSNREVKLDLELLEYLATNTKAKILLVDDAVDSGATFDAAIRAIHLKHPQVQIHTAAITQTFKKPLVAPEFVLYRDVLVRFPWSLDSA